MFPLACRLVRLKYKTKNRVIALHTIELQQSKKYYSRVTINIEFQKSFGLKWSPHHNYNNNQSINPVIYMTLYNHPKVTKVLYDKIKKITK